MMHQIQQLIVSVLLLSSCDTGKLTVVADIPTHLKEVSACETTSNSNLIWIIEDSGNDNHLYGLDIKGAIKKDLTILNSENDDWEDLTSDDQGTIYIGDFGNNSEKRKDFTIYKVSNPESTTEKVSAEKINFTLPTGTESEDFEAFFVYQNTFYIFSKEKKNCEVLKVPNEIGNHTAVLLTEFELKGKDNRVTSADISADGKTIVLLNHDKIWKLTNYENDNFFEGKVESLDFGHDSQKEGVCFDSKNRILITDENKGAMGSNIYSFELH